MSYKFIQISDLGLDSTINAHLSDKLNSLRVQTFINAVDLAVDSHADGFIICGNLYDQKYLSYSNAQVIKDGFERLHRHNISIIYAHGKIDSGELFKGINENVTDFMAAPAKWEFMTSMDANPLTIWGAGYSDNLIEITASLPKKATTQPVIGIMHINMDDYTEYEIMQIFNNLKRTSYNYWALGGSHYYRQVDEYGAIVYSGCPIARFKKHSGAVLVEIDDSGRVSSTLIPISDEKYEYLEIDINGCSSLDEVMDKCLDVIYSMSWNKDKLLLEISLTGAVEFYNQLCDNLSDFTDALTQKSGSIIKVWTDKLVRAYDRDKYAMQKSYLSEALTLFDEVMLSDDKMEEILESAKERVGLCTQVSSLSQAKYLLKNVDSIIIDAMYKEGPQD